MCYEGRAFILIAKGICIYIKRRNYQKITTHKKYAPPFLGVNPGMTLTILIVVEFTIYIYFNMQLILNNVNTIFILIIAYTDQR